MPKIRYELKNFTAKTAEVIAQAEGIIDEYRAQGFSLTLRQLYYQFVARGLIANTEREYKRIGNIVSDARRAGMIDWTSIEDRTRFLRSVGSWESPQQILQTAVDGYHVDLWSSQSTRIEVWIEKDALVGVIDGVCTDLDVPFFSCRGYVSDSEMWRAARRADNHSTTGQGLIVLHLGDHDPSGIDMSRDIEDRYNLFTRSADVTVRRIALTMEQVEEVNPPPNPAKMTDSRFEGYSAEYGDDSWELDALEPQYIVDLIRQNIQDEMDMERWQEAIDQQESEREQIRQVIDRWDELF